MTRNYREVWDNYAASWRVKTTAEKRALYQRSLTPDCQYIDPLAAATGWDELETYMLEFHRQIPGGHFVTTKFLSHNDRCVAQWEMRNADEVVVGDGISYGVFDSQGKLTSMTGFFELPPTPETAN